MNCSCRQTCDASFASSQVPFDAMLKQAFSEAPDTGVLLGATIPTGVGTAWIFGRKGHPFMEMVTKRLLTEYRWCVLFSERVRFNSKS